VNQAYQQEQLEAVRAVGLAARVCRAVRAGLSPEVLAKKDRSPVTVADFASQAVVCHALQQAFPDDPIIAEEDSAELREPRNSNLLEEVVAHVRRLGPTYAEATAAEVCNWIDRGECREYRDRFWTVDPIDGTKGFLRNEQYAVALALIVRGRVVVAALACPNLPVHAGQEQSEAGLVFAAVRGQGAFAVGLEAEANVRNGLTSIHVSYNMDPGLARFCESVESGHSAHGDAAAIAERLGITSPPLRLDSQAKYGVIARGEAEIYLRMPTRLDYREKIWDHAAGTLIVEEAGGTVTDITGRPLEFHHGRELTANRGVIVASGVLHGRVLQAIRDLNLDG
jgi:3'(2'), 5'-bisphosphate nucleotidase